MPARASGVAQRRLALTGGRAAPSAVFAFSSSYAFLLIARSLQGIGSSCSSVAGRCAENPG